MSIDTEVLEWYRSYREKQSVAGSAPSWFLQVARDTSLWKGASEDNLAFSEKKRDINERRIAAVARFKAENDKLDLELKGELNNMSDIARIHNLTVRNLPPNLKFKVVLVNTDTSLKTDAERRKKTEEILDQYKQECFKLWEQGKKYDFYF